ncbi:MAG: hypothetical protein M1837_004645 [Sclerophora amabilis]|nr:MAG: hypothetical protein M1837_004645 [Sclerophora amabilis]
MSLNSSSSLATSKSITNTPPQTNSFTQSQTNVASSSEGHFHRRSGGSGAFGAGSTSRNALYAPRNHQSLRKQHKAQRRPRLADEDAIAESAAMKSTSSRKGQTSITHLMSFSLPPRPQYNHRSNLNGRSYRRNPTWGLGSGYHAVDKARYVHANYRFVVNPKLDFHAQAIDADIHLDWGSVLQILASEQTQCSTCPICLSTPVAPRMAKCGHIFCLPCLIRYMHSTDDSNPQPEKRARWKKCPICWDSIYTSEVRPVRWFTGQEGQPPREGEDVILRLVMRQPGSTLALPRDGADALASSEDIPWHFAAEVADYARVMKGSEEYMMAQFDQEIDQLQQLEREDELIYGDEPAWTRKAVNTIKESKERVKGIGNPPSMPKAPTEKKSKQPPIQFNDNDDSIPDMYMVQHVARSGHSSAEGASTPQSYSVASPAGDSTDASSTSLLADTLAESTLHDRSEEKTGDLMGQATTRSENSSSAPHSKSRVQNTDIKPQDSPYYFYQALLHYYLSPLDIRVLKAAFGNFASFPATILPRVEHVSTGHIVDDDLRKRAKYLGHLPYGCEVGFLECDWNDVVAPEILDKFKLELDRRRRKNKDKEVREEKERVRAEREEEDKRWASARRKRSSFTPETIPERGFEPQSSGDAGNAFSSIEISGSSASPPWGSSSRNRNGSAFASLASPSTSPAASRTVWGTTAIAPASPETHPEHVEPETSDNNDGWLQGWEKDLLQEEEEVLAQVQAASTAERATQQNAGAASPAAAKKKKGKKITLMSTNARRGA